ncbi:MAG: hypothetical protein ABI383_12855 [Acidobacteriaceae bacterium]
MKSNSEGKLPDKTGRAAEQSAAPASWEAETVANTGRRPTDSAYVKGTVPQREGEREQADLELEAQAQTAGNRGPLKTTVQRKHDTNSKTSTHEPSPKQSNPLTRSNHGAAEKRGGAPDAQGITAHGQEEEDQRQKKVVSRRDDAQAGGRRTGSKPRAA